MISLWAVVSSSARGFSLWYAANNRDALGRLGARR